MQAKIVSILATLAGIPKTKTLPWCIAGSVPLSLFKKGSWKAGDMDMWVVAESDAAFKAAVLEIGIAFGKAPIAHPRCDTIFEFEMANLSRESSFKLSVIKCRDSSVTDPLRAVDCFDISVCKTAICLVSALPKGAVVCPVSGAPGYSFVVPEDIRAEIYSATTRVFPMKDGSLSTRTVERMAKYAERGYKFVVGPKRDSPSPYSTEKVTVITKSDPVVSKPDPLPGSKPSASQPASTPVPLETGSSSSSGQAATEPAQTPEASSSSSSRYDKK